MNVAIMQPYVFPYLGYFNLLHASDVFVFLDDVQFIRRGWINRNRIQIGDEAFSFTIPLAKAPRETVINQMRVSPEHFTEFQGKFAKQLRSAYGAAPFFGAVSPLVERAFQPPVDSIAEVAMRSVRATLDYVGLRKSTTLASELGVEASGKQLSGADRLIHIARSLGATGYINPPGGRELYSPDAFAAAGLSLRFVRPHLRPYDRPGQFIPGLSILDALMHFPPTDVAGMIADYSIEP